MAVNTVLSTATISKATVGAKATITINKAKASYVHTLEYTFKSFSGTIVEKHPLGSYEWTVPTDFYNELDSSEAIATLHCTTYDGTFKLGTTNIDFTVYPNPYDTPTISPLIKDTNSTTIALTGNANKLVRYRSTAYVTINATAKNGATIASQKVSNAGAYFTTATGSIGNVESESFLIEATDSRGLSAAVSINLATAGRWIEYNLPTCNMGTSKPNSAGNMTVECSGTWWNQNFGAANNTATAQYRYKVEGGSYGSWTNMNVSTSGNDYSAYASLSGLNYQTTYVFQARVIDKLSTTESAEYKVRALPVFSWGKDDFEFNVPVHFAAGTTGTTEPGGSSEAGFVDGDFTIKGDLRLKRDESNYGCTLRFGDSNYAYITETTDDDITIYASDLNLNANVRVNSNTIDAGVWTPSLDSSAVSSYSSRQGWYLRIGQNVSIGWTIKATIKSGYQATPIKITGAPCVSTYGVANQSAGGGMCSNAYIAGGYTFQCFVMETNGTITTRVQACNNTSNTNLATSASGCLYPINGGELTLVGSITYRAMSEFK